MFNYLTNASWGVLKELSPRRLIEILDSPDEHSAKLVIYSHGRDIWIDLCKFHFGVAPQPEQNPYDLFFYAAKHGSFNMLYEASQNALENGNKTKAINDALKAAEIYRAPGHILCLSTYLTLMDQESNSSAKQEYAKQAYHQLLLIERTYSDSTLALKNTGWSDIIDQKFGGIDQFAADKKGILHDELSDEQIQEIENEFKPHHQFNIA